MIIKIDPNWVTCPRFTGRSANCEDNLFSKHEKNACGRRSQKKKISR